MVLLVHSPLLTCCPTWCPSLSCPAAVLLSLPQERVRRLVEEVCLLCTRTALCNPPGAKHFALTKV